MTFILASNNPGKKAEMTRILGSLGIEIKTAADLGLTPPDPEETGETFAENAYIKARAFCDAFDLPAIADDSGLCVDALGGAPGLRTARFAGENAADGTNISKLLGCLAGVPAERRGAAFVSHITCLFPDGRRIDAEGRCEGFISDTPMGDGGFGYDPVFLVRPGLSMAMLDDRKKDAVSHRGKALRTLKCIMQNS
ncbi:MAG: RdgB/HAM1 family non-canonical purine NTP pyrophosphatase [Oscillospiraceae bacterium]|nr:RdgB/HAM1 family non-canonical purine NTP pyrophosphatase [Oscillospiraceae bacterium]